jgi:protein disulfide-isomerase A1
MFFRTFEEPKVAYTGAADKESLMNFVKPLTVPTVFEFSEDMIEPIFGQQQSTLFFFTSEKEPSPAFNDAAFANKGKVLFSFSGVKDGIQERLAEFVGATEADLPFMMLLVPGNMKKFRAEVPALDATVDDITAFVDGVLAGDIKPHLKSDPVPAQDGPVTVVVGTEFEKIVMDPTKDVLVKFYAPWCGHCKKLAPIWDKLGEEFAAVEDLVIAKFDSTTNEADGVEVQSYPTLTFYPKDNKAGVPYEGGRELDDIKKWLEENSSALKSVPTEDL